MGFAQRCVYFEEQPGAFDKRFFSLIKFGHMVNLQSESLEWGSRYGAICISIMNGFGGRERASVFEKVFHSSSDQ